MRKDDIVVKLLKAVETSSQSFFNYVSKHLSLKFNLFLTLQHPLPFVLLIQKATTSRAKTRIFSSYNTYTP
jgi:hypothetical protein